MLELLQSSGLGIPASFEHPSKYGTPMSEVKHILSQIESVDPTAAEKLPPLVYEELRRLAAARMASECPEHTRQATA